MGLKTLVVVAVIGLGTAAGVMGSARAAAAQSGPRVGQPAAEITGGPWINSDPLSMEKLRGRVVYVEFWTYG